MIQHYSALTERPKCDKCIVAQTGWIDLRSAFAGMSIDGSSGAPEGQYNGIEQPGSIMGRPDDVFAAHRAAKAYSAVAASGSEGHPEGNAGGE